MTRFYNLQIADLRKETDDCAVISFDVPEQFRDEFRYHQGQYLTMRTHIDGHEVRRSYSLCSSPLENKWTVAVKKFEGGLFSTFANERLKKGDVLEVMPPNGNFFVETNPDTAREYVAFAAGSGITPILSILKTHLATEPQSTFKLFYLNRNVKSILFKEEIEALKSKYFNRIEVFYFLTKEFRDIPLFNGRFTEDKLDTICTRIIDIPKTDAAFICGPESMIFMVRDALQKAGMEKAKIHFELFNTSGAKNSEAARKVAEKQAEGTEVTIIDGGKEFHFTMSKEFDNILDAALSAGADLPFACKGGVCSTCRCKVIEGSAEMKINYALEEADVARNFVLSCQAVPTSPKLIVDFDV